MSTNQSIIIDEGVKHGVFTETEAELMLLYGQDIPLHTFVGWHNLGKTPRKGEHGIPTRLWKRSKDKSDNENEREKFILVKSYLFSASQVEDIAE